MTRMDRLALYSDKMRNGKCRLLARPTMIARSQYVAVVHHDTVKPHIHVVINRVTMDGKVSDSNEIMRRSALVAEAINRERGWTSAVDVRAERAADIRAAALDILRAMPRYDFALYARAMDERGYRLSVKQDSNGRPAHYTVCCGRSRFRASDLPRRDLTVAHLPQTWARLHGIRDSPTLARFTDETADFGTIAHENGQRDTATTHEYRPRVPCVSAEKAGSQESRETPEAMYNPKRATPPLTAVEAEANGRSYSVLLPEAVYAAMRDECCDIADETDDFCDIDRALMPLAAVLWQSATLAGGLAAIYFEAATDIQPACGGGSSSQSLKRDDDDDMESLARRAARRAAYHYGITPRRSSRGRGR